MRRLSGKVAVLFVLAFEIGDEMRERVRGSTFGVLDVGLRLSMADAMVTVFAVRRARQPQVVEMFRGFRG